MGYIYKIYNDINNKVYIGKTCTSISNRWLHHQNDYQKYDWHLYRAMRKYGIENFHIEQIECCKDDILNEREQYWINYFNSFEYGYNMTIGGDGREQIDREQVKEKWLQGKSVRDISKEMNTWYSTIVNILKELNMYDQKEINKRKIKNVSVSQSQEKIYQYDEEGNLLNIYDSVYMAAIAVGGVNSSIQSGCYSGGSRYGFYWRKESQPLPNFKPIKRCYIRTIEQYDKQGNFISEYSNAAEAYRNTGISSSGILKCCKGQRKSAGNFIWKYKKED